MSITDLKIVSDVLKVSNFLDNEGSLIAVDIEKALEFFKKLIKQHYDLTRHGDLISAYDFILALDVIVALAYPNSNIEDLQFFSQNFLYSAYADDTTFFLRNQ